MNRQSGRNLWYILLYGKCEYKREIKIYLCRPVAVLHFVFQSRAIIYAVLNTNKNKRVGNKT